MTLRRARKKGARKKATRRRRRESRVERYRRLKVENPPDPGQQPEGPPECTPSAVHALARIGCTIRNMADFFGITESGMKRRFQASADLTAAATRGRMGYKVNLRRNLLNLSAHNASAAIFLAKNELGMSDHGPVEAELERTPGGLKLTVGPGQRHRFRDLLDELPELSDAERREIEAELLPAEAHGDRSAEDA